MTILALDIAKRVGWASPQDSGVADFSALDDWGELAFKFQDWLHDRLQFCNVKVLVLERPFLAAKSDNAMIPSHMTWTAHQVAYEFSISRCEVPPSTWRKDLLGAAMRRTEAKAKSVEWCHQHGFDPIDDNEADAICLLNWYINFAGEKR